MGTITEPNLMWWHHYFHHEDTTAIFKVYLNSQRHQPCSYFALHKYRYSVFMQEFQHLIRCGEGGQECLSPQICGPLQHFYMTLKCWQHPSGNQKGVIRFSSAPRQTKKRGRGYSLQMVGCVTSLICRISQDLCISSSKLMPQFFQGSGQAIPVNWHLRVGEVFESFS